MAELEKPYPPGEYSVVVVGSGPGGLQTSYFLTKRGIDHALISRDDSAGGMFRKFPFFDRLITWTKPHAKVPRGTREYQWYDWNSLLVEDPKDWVSVAEFMDGTSEFPSREEMERSLVAFAERANVKVRYECAWTGTRMEADGSFVLETTDGEYRCKVAIFAVGMTEPWRPAEIPGIEDVPHYMEVKPAKEYEGKKIYILGKANSAFEIADGLLPWASQMILTSPRPTRISILTHSTAGARARYMQPYEDHALAGGSVSVLDATTEKIEKTDKGFRVWAKGTTREGDFIFDVDETIVATGVSTPMIDLPKIGVKTFYRGGRLPAQTPYWESPTVPGIYFAGSITQGSFGLKKYSGSPAVHGFRYNCRVLVDHVVEKHFGKVPPPKVLEPKEVVPFLLSEASHAPELWNQQSYLGRVVTFDDRNGIVDAGIEPMSHFVDAEGPDAVAMAIDLDDEGEFHPAAYVRSGGKVDQHILDSNTLIDFETREHRKHLSSILEKFL